MEGITINDKTVKSLKLWLAQFPDDAKIVFFNKDTYKEHELVIACNFEHQKANNKVMLTSGMRLEYIEEMLKIGAKNDAKRV